VVVRFTGGRTERYCAFCGGRFADTDTGWPRDCPECAETTWRNPIPVGVAVVPVRRRDTTGLLVIHRAIEPGLGLMSFPGGYVDRGESWQDAVIRELREEVGLRRLSADVRLLAAHSGVGVLLLFGILPTIDEADLPESAPTAETFGWDVVTEPVELAFPHHTGVLAEYLGTRI
jgi:8-oxo-dGTP pyrophosphatase MutT (NUDIX family)